MPSSPPTVADLAAEVVDRCGFLLQPTGIYRPGGLTPVVIEGLRRGCKAVMLTLTNPLVLQDSDVAALSGFAIERVEDEAELFSLNRSLAFWHLATQKHQEAISSNVVASGYLVDARRAIKDRIAELKAACDTPYREPSDPVTVLDSDYARWPDHGCRYGYGRGYPDLWGYW